MNAANEWVTPNSTAPAWTTSGTGAVNCWAQAPFHPASPTYGKLAEALARAQGELKPAVKDAKNPFFNSKYADLSSVWEAIREALTKNGLAVVQAIDLTTGEKPVQVLKTMLIHTSGEYITSQYLIQPAKNDPQGVGSAITYARRYALSALVGVVADEDDDGEAATREKKVASVTGAAETKKPKWTAEQKQEGGAIRARIIEATGDTGDNDVKQLLARMAYDQPTDVIDAMAALLKTHQDIADRAKGPK